MSVSAFDLYLLTVLGHLNKALTVGTTLTAATVAVVSVVCLISRLEGFAVSERVIVNLRRGAALAVVLGTLAVLTPSKKELIAIFAIPHVINNEKVQQLPDVFLDYVIKEFSVEEKK